MTNEQMIKELKAGNNRLKQKSKADSDAVQRLVELELVHNACNEPCDVVEGPCACGAWHSIPDFIPRVIKHVRALQANGRIVREIRKLVD